MSRRLVCKLVVGLVALGVGSSCTPPPGPADVAVAGERAAGRDSVQEEGAGRNVDELRHDTRALQSPMLDIFTTSLLTDGRTAHIRGRVKNSLPARVEGIRYVITLYPRDSLKPLDTIRHEADTVLEPGSEAALRLDIESLYLGSEPRFVITAVPAKLGGREVPAP